MSANRKNGNTITKEERAEKQINMKMNALTNIDSIFILPHGPEGFAMAGMARFTDRVLSGVKRKFGTTVDLKTAKEVFKDYQEFADKLWKFLYEISPNHAHIDQRDWRNLNDDPSDKKALASRRTSYVVTPRSEESGQIAMAVKVIQVKNVQIRNTVCDFDDLEKFQKKYTKYIADFDRLLIATSDRLKMKYESKVINA